MKRLFIWYLISGICYLSLPLANADLPPLRTQDTVRVSRGKVRFSAVLADDNGEVYIEVPQGINAKIAGQAYFNFDGFLLAPNVVSLPFDFPLQRSREIVNFEFLADNGDPVHFSDKYFAVPLKRRLFTENEKAKAITVYIPIHQAEYVRDPQLWYYDENLTEDTFDDEWRLVGGVFESTSDPETDLFSAVVTKTGLYTLVDRRPLPRFSENVDPSIIQEVEDSPFPSVNPINDPDAPLELQEDLESSLLEGGTQFIGGSEGAIPTPIQIGSSTDVTEEEIPAVRPLPQEDLGGLVPTTQPQNNGSHSEIEDSEVDKIPSIENQNPGEQGPESHSDSEFLEPLTEEDILAQIQNQPPQKTLDPSDLQTNTFDKDSSLPRSGNTKDFTWLILALLIGSGGWYWYRQEKKETREETR